MKAKKQKKGLVEIKAPVNGTFQYLLPEVKIGSRVKPDTTLGVIATLGMEMDATIEAGIVGIIVKKLVRNNRRVKYDQVLFRLKPD